MFADGFAESVGWGKAKDAQSEGGKKKRKKKAAAVTEEEEPMADWEKFVMQVRRAVKLMHCDRCRLEPRSLFLSSHFLPLPTPIVNRFAGTARP